VYCIVSEKYPLIVLEVGFAAGESRRMADGQHGTYPIPGLLDRDGYVAG
jgi:hypothetical protein